MKAVEVQSITFCYRDRPVLQDVSFSIEKGEFIGIIGPNGGGKTTLLKLLMGFLSPRSGSIRLFNNPPQKARLSIGYVPQAHRFDRDFPITVQELILMGSLSRWSAMRPLPLSVQSHASQLIDRLGLGPHRGRAFGTLSGGLAQRALFARALLSEPSLLLLDEATANIDPPSAAAIIEYLEELKGKKTILLVTHQLKTILQQVDRVLCVEGKITSYLPKDLCNHYALGLYHPPLPGS